MSASLWPLSIALNEEEARVAELALRLSLDTSELGAVLFGDKPLCLESIENNTRSYLLRERHVLLGECYRQFLPIWSRINLKKGSFALIEGVTGEAVMPLWINKAAFLSVVEEHLPFFQAILGPLITPQGLLETFLTPEVDFFEVLQGNKILIGILLGFGKQNSMLHARIEEIDSPAISGVKVPLQPHPLAPVEWLTDPYFACWHFSPCSLLPRPTPGCSCLREEGQLLINKYSSSSWKHPCAKGRHVPLFGCDPTSQETKKLLDRYRRSAEKTERLLESPQFLAKALALLLGVSKVDLHISPTSENHFLDKFALHRSVAAALVRGAFEDELAFRGGFIAGLRGVEAPSSAINDTYLDYFEAEYALLAQENLTASEAFFTSIGPEWTELVPQQLYYRTLRPGKGAPVAQETKTVRLCYSITPIEGTASGDHSYGDTFGDDCQHSLAELIPGMSHAIVGMRPYERREILVHPAHAYGVASRFEPGVSLRIKVTLWSHRGFAEPLPPLERISLTPPELKHDPDECLWVLGHEAGAEAWAYLGQASDLIDREEVIKELEAWDPGDEQDIMAFSHLQVELCRRRYGL
ncbi:MAG: hypothetical protein JSR80_06425 [Verrucomicrobia bacterium]|nr:hypothetical protein [Verrucomicrobiota bacterium]